MASHARGAIVVIRPEVLHGLLSTRPLIGRSERGQQKPLDEDVRAASNDQNLWMALGLVT